MQDTEVAEKEYEDGRDDPAVHTADIGKRRTVFGPGVADLLELVEEKGSIQGACSEMGMSYSKSWKIIKRAERELGYPLLSSHNGGTAGGKSELTEKGKWFLQQYREMEEALRRKMEDVFREYFPAE